MRQRLVVLTITASLSAVPLFAQYSPNRHLVLDRLQVLGVLYDTTKANYQVRLPYLSAVPPYTTNSTLERFVAYTVIDSVLRYVSKDSLVSWLSGLTDWNDTTGALSKYYYNAVDDNPGEFAQYELETRLKQINDGREYLGDTATVTDTMTTGYYLYSFTSVKPKLRKALRIAWPTDSTRRAFSTLLGASIVVRGTVISIDTARNKLNSERSSVMAVTLSVTDTIKGKVLPGFPQWTMPPVAASSHILTVPPPLNSIRFEYVPELYPEYTESWSHGLSYDRDMSISDSVSGKFTMSVGDDVVVFLSFMNALIDDDYDYFTLGVDTSLSGGVLTIEAGNVKDPNMIWGNSSVQSYAAWRSRVNSIITIINQ